MSARLYTIIHKQTGQVVALIEASTPSQAYSRLCQEDYRIEVTKAIDVGPHIRNGGRVITGIMEDFHNALGGENNVVKS
jgi:hypothetical protein